MCDLTCNCQRERNTLCNPDDIIRQMSSDITLSIPLVLHHPLQQKNVERSTFFLPSYQSPSCCITLCNFARSCKVSPNRFAYQSPPCSITLCKTGTKSCAPASFWLPIPPALH